MNKPARAIIIGAGPAGLTAAYELLSRSQIKPIVLEKSEDMGGLSKTVEYKGNRIDIGGHRFFSKSDRVMKWWLDMMPLEEGAEGSIIQYHKMQARVGGGSAPVDARTADRVMLLRNRTSRIYFLRKLFEYPIRLNKNTLRIASALVAAGIAFNRTNVVLLAMNIKGPMPQFGAEIYYPSLVEWGISIGLIAATIFLFGLAVRLVPLLPAARTDERMAH